MEFYTQKNKQRPMIKGGHIDFLCHLHPHLTMMKFQKKSDAFLAINMVINPNPNPNPNNSAFKHLL